MLSDGNGCRKLKVSSESQRQREGIRVLVRELKAEPLEDASISLVNLTVGLPTIGVAFMGIDVSIRSSRQPMSGLEERRLRLSRLSSEQIANSIRL